jgi:hypothetical protein
MRGALLPVAPLQSTLWKCCKNDDRVEEAVHNSVPSLCLEALLFVPLSPRVEQVACIVLSSPRHLDFLIRAKYSNQQQRNNELPTYHPCGFFSKCHLPLSLSKGDAATPAAKANATMFSRITSSTQLL